MEKARACVLTMGESSALAAKEESLKKRIKV